MKCQEFYFEEEISRVLPCKKDVMLDSTKQPVQKHLMCVTQREAYQKFSKSHPSIKIGQRIFDSCRPKNVCHSSKTSRTMCSCIWCHNVSMKIQAFKIFRSGLESIRQSSQDKEKQEVTALKLESYEMNFENIVNSTVCPHEDKRYSDILSR